MNNQKTTFLTLCLSIAFVIPCLAQNTEKADSIINVIAYFSKNDTVSYKETIFKCKITGNDTIVQSAVEQEYMLIVRDSTATEYTIECKDIDFHVLTDIPSYQDLLTRTIWEKTNHIPLIFKVDSLGTFKSITNWDEVRKDLNTCINTIAETMVADFGDKIFNAEGIKNMLHSTFDSEEAYVNASPMLSKLFGMYGYSLTLGKTKAKGETMGYPTDITCFTTINKEDSKEDEEVAYAGDYSLVSVSKTVIPATDAMKLGIGNVKQTLSEDALKNIDEQKIMEQAKNMKDLSRTDTEVYSYFFNGWPKHYGEEIIVEFNDQQTITSTEIEWSNYHWQ